MWIGIALWLLAVGAPGCSSAWVYSIEDAESRFQRQPQTRLILFKDHLDPASGQMESNIFNPPVAPLIEGMIRCMLVARYGPNRDYVARYGVDRFPALIVVHPDGTYHTLLGSHDPDKIVEFLRNARPPGLAPRTARGASPDAFTAWESNYAEAMNKAARTKAPLLLIYKWWVSKDSVELLRRLNFPAVQRRTQRMVVCVLDYEHEPNRAIIERYGVNTVPAMILIQPGGIIDRLIGLRSVDEIQQFLSKRDPAGSLLSPDSGASIEPPIP